MMGILYCVIETLKYYAKEIKKPKLKNLGFLIIQIYFNFSFFTRPALRSA